MSECLMLKKTNCKNCYKCIRHCPVKAIRFTGNQAHIIEKECILCGQCFVVCPQNAKQIVNEVEKVQVLINSGDPVYVSIAPSFIANYEGVGIESMRKALMQLGFAGVEETAVGATIVKREYERMLREDKPDVVISSCCHSVNLLIQKHFPEALPFLANVMSPMQAHCTDIKKRFPNAKTVFIGPCVSKKDEAQRYPGIVDAVLTYEELSDWLVMSGINPEKNIEDCEESRARLFPTTGGILKTFTEEQPEYTYIAVDGTENCMEALKDIVSGNIHKCFIEMSSCTGSCIGGPVMEKYKNAPIKEFKAVSQFAGKKDFVVEQPEKAEIKKEFLPLPEMLRTPLEDEIRRTLKKMGKNGPEDELNCGTCGYNTCREKAIAVCQGKAEISMCLPYLKDRAESFSDTIVNNTPNGIVVLNEDLEVQQINHAALDILNLHAAKDVLSENISCVMDPISFVDALESDEPIRQEHMYLSDYKKYISLTVVHDTESRVILGIMKDTTEQEVTREKKLAMAKHTMEIADKVVEKQMRVAQEMAALLGETVAETKTALTKLKESVQDE